jgi:hypothetical protein
MELAAAFDPFIDDRILVFFGGGGFGVETRLADETSSSSSSESNSLPDPSLSLSVSSSSSLSYKSNKN